MTRTLVIIPTYNEALNIEALVTKVVGLPSNVDVLVVDDGSPDGTGAIVQELGSRYPSRVHILRRNEKGGRGAAVLAGIRRGLDDERYVRFAEMDADLSHLPDELPALLDAAEAADVVIGSRYGAGSAIVGWSRRRKAWSRASNSLLGAVLNLPTADYTNGFRVYSRRAARHLVAADLGESGYIALSEWACALHDAGMSFVDVPTTFVNRRYGASKMGVGEATSALRALLRLRRRRRGASGRLAASATPPGRGDGLS